MKRCFLFFIFVITFVLFVWGCDRDEPVVNIPPDIVDFLVPDVVTVGDKVKLEVVVYDKNQDTLTYSWEVSEGTVDETGTWIVPTGVTSAKIVVRVSDGTTKVSTQKRVDIIKPPPPPDPLPLPDRSPQLDPPPERMASIPGGKVRDWITGGCLRGSFIPRDVHVDAFYMDKYEVTNAQYQEFVLAKPRWQKRLIARDLTDRNYLRHWNGNNYPNGEADHPVAYVSWYAASAYARWVGKRLPKEVEWVYAVRGGSSNVIQKGAGNYGNPFGGTMPVGSYAPNKYGLYNMFGNVEEWCRDSEGVVGSRLSSARGDSWFNIDHNIEIGKPIACVLKSSADDTFPDRGFRCAKSITP